MPIFKKRIKANMNTKKQRLIAARAIREYYQSVKQAHDGLIDKKRILDDKFEMDQKIYLENIERINEQLNEMARKGQEIEKEYFKVTGQAE